MIITVRVMPRSSQKKIVETDNGLKVYVHESATDGKANDAVCALLADKYNVAKSQIQIRRGARTRQKIIEIMQ